MQRCGDVALMVAITKKFIEKNWSNIFTWLGVLFLAGVFGVGGILNAGGFNVFSTSKMSHDCATKADLKKLEDMIIADRKEAVSQSNILQAQITNINDHIINATKSFNQNILDLQRLLLDKTLTKNKGKVFIGEKKHPYAGRTEDG